MKGDLGLGLANIGIINTIMIEIKTALLSDLDVLREFATEEVYFERCLEEQAAGNRDVLLIFTENKLAGYCQYQRRPQYQPFRSLKIPEIQDLFIRPDYRQNGFATKLIEYCEDKALKEGHDMIGIGVGLYSSYGKAQRLYMKLGYQPDGGGIVYERNSVMPGQLYKVDDELCLMMIKQLV